MTKKRKSFDTIIVGGGIAGLVTALELLAAKKHILILDRDVETRLGGLANLAFGGMTLIDTPIQRKQKINDSADLAYRDWLSFARFSSDDEIPMQWARFYVENSREWIYEWLLRLGVKFFPAVHWVERGETGDGNSVPRYHLVWGTGQGLMEAIRNGIHEHANADHLHIRCEHHVTDLQTTNGAVSGVTGKSSEGRFEFQAQQVVLACGGINGNLEMVRKHWDPDLGQPPRVILNGAHPFADGSLHRVVDTLGGKINKLHQMWNYAAGVHDPEHPDSDRGLSLIPPRSALWLDANGKRFGPTPLVSGFDTNYLCKQVSRSLHGYSWQILNRKIALKELAVSGSKYNEAFRERSYFKLVTGLLKGDAKLLDWLIAECVDFLVADSVEALVAKMNALSDGPQIEVASLRQIVNNYDLEIARGPALFNDPQLLRIAQLRRYKGDRVRTCAFQPIDDPKAGPLIAIREHIISRKSMGGMQTDLQSRVLTRNGQAIDGLYAVGEATGFGGGGISGRRSLEGTFLSGCILSARLAARSIAGGA